MIGVFGANGFIGRHVTRHFVEAGYDVTAVGRSFEPDLVRLATRTFQSDLRDVSAMRAALDSVETVVQLIGTSTPAQGNSRSTEHIENDVLPHVAFLDQCVAAGVRRFVFASSGGTVYGPTSPHELTPESAPTNPISSHGVTKLTVEHFIKLHGHLDGLEYLILRIANPYGPGQVYRRGQGLVPALMDRYRAGMPITIYGDGSAARDYLYISDLVRAVDASVRYDGHPQAVLNVGTGERRTVLEMVRAIEDILDIEFQIGFAPARETDVGSIALDIAQIGHMLGWKPEVSFRTGLSVTLSTAC